MLNNKSITKERLHKIIPVVTNALYENLKLNHLYKSTINTNHPLTGGKNNEKTSYPS